MITDNNGILYLEGKPIFQHMKAWAFIAEAEWLPVLLTSYRLPGMAPEWVPSPSNNGKHHHTGAWVASVCKHTTEKGGLFLSFPEGDKPEGWFSWETKLEINDPRTWALWEAGKCEEENSTPFSTHNAKEIMKMRPYRDNMHPIFLRKGQFTNVVVPGFSYLYCTLI